MSKNSPRQTIQAVKEWLEFTKIKPKPRPKSDNSYNSIGEFMKRDK
jgi:hypothetical protein